ncbi:MAG: tyrosine--tRNA ligase [Pseudomonadota bacterium]
MASTTHDDLIAELSWRGLMVQSSHPENLAAHLNSGPRTLYCGFDPTADSLHIGSLVPLLTLRRFQQFGHRPILLLGGATGLIGDPSFKDDERSLNSAEVVAGWVESLRKQVLPFLHFEGSNAAIICNNLDWTAKMDVVSFLRDIGKHFSVNAMIQRDSVRNRLERADQGISYTEFSYMLLQGMDYLELARQHDCTLQIGGQDQWGNIVSGVDLVRRHLSREVYAVTLPLVTKADGTKFGKTAGGTIWLDAAKTSPYTFYQFWLNSADADTDNYLKLFTFLGQEEVAELAQATAERPEQRLAQKRLAELVTELVHGADAVASAQRISACLFGGDVRGLQAEDLEQLQQDGLESTTVAGDEGLLSAMVQAGVAKSTGEARKLVQGGGVRLDGKVVEDAGCTLDFADALFGRFHILRRGKKVYHLLIKAA